MFHWSPIRLREGSIVEPGNFGRMIRRYRPDQFGDGWRLARELLFEQAREAYAPKAPSRLNACFMCPTYDDAMRYQAAYDPHFLQVLHEVEIVELGASQHSGALILLDENQNMSFLDSYRRQARDYWEGRGEGDRELFTASSIRVVRVF